MRSDRPRRARLVFGVRMSRETPWQRLVFGLSILAAGTLFWLDRIGTIHAHDYIVWWPVALLAMGLAHLLEGRWVGGAIWLFIGAYFFLPLVGIGRVHLWQIIGLWPLLISVGGVTLMLQALRRAGRDPSFRAVAVMGGNNRTVGSQTFQSGEAVAVMGGCEIDLSAARIENEAVIDVLAFWGGIELRVPRGWRVKGRVATILGGFSDTTEPAPEGAPQLVVRGSVIMGGIEVRNARETTAA
jgi:hypothetical protein